MLTLLIVSLFLGSVLVVHLRGRVKQPLARQLVDHSAWLAPVNVLLYAGSAVPAQPYLDLAQFPELQTLREHVDTIREEALRLQQADVMRRPDKNDDAGFNSFAKSGWRRFYLKWYDSSHPSAQRECPKTVSLLAQIPSIKAAMFAELPPGAKLNPHRDPYAGSLRYHLGLVTPNDDACYIEVDGQRYSWRDGEAVMFDETFVHEAANGTEVSRLILFCDVERPMRGPILRAFNRWFAKSVVSLAASPNVAGDQVGVINRLFGLSVVAGRWRRRFKAWNRSVYRLTKLLAWTGLLAGLAYLIFA